MTRTSFLRRLRAVSVPLTVAYLCCTLAGLAAIVSIPTTVANTSNAVAGYVWAAFLILGGALSGSDLFTGRRGGELLGNPLLIVVLFLYGVSILYRQWHTPGLASAATVVAWLVLGFTCFITGRFMVIYTEAREAR